MQNVSPVGLCRIRAYRLQALRFINSNPLLVQTQKPATVNVGIFTLLVPALL